MNMFNVEQNLRLRAIELALEAERINSPSKAEDIVKNAQIYYDFINKEGKHEPLSR